MVQTVFLLHLARGMWFFGDDWDFLLERGTVPGADRGLFGAHNGHWSTGPVVIMRGMFAMFGLRQHLPYAMVPITIQVLTTITMYLLLRRCGARAAPTLIGCLAIALPGLGSEAVLALSGTSLGGSTLFGVLACYVLVRSGFSRRGLAGASVLVLVSLAFSGAGLTSLVLVVVLAFTARGWRAALALAAPPLALYLVWFLLVGRAASPPMTDSWELLKLPAYVFMGLSGALESLVGAKGVGAALLLVVLGGLLLAPRPTSLHRHLAWAGLVAAVAQLVMAGLSRLSMGLESAASGRYVLVGLVLLTPTFVLLLSVLGETVPARVPVLALTALLILGFAANAVRLQIDYQEFWQGVASKERDRVLGVLAAADTGAALLTPTAGEFLEPLRAPLLLSPQARRAVTGSATPRQRVEAEGTYFVGVGPSDYHQDPATDLELVTGFQGAIAVSPGCERYIAWAVPQLRLFSQRGATITVTSQSRKITTSLSRGAQTSSTRTWNVQPGVPVQIATSARDAELLVGFDGTGEYLVCKQ